jgi:hypothetical protein
MRTLTTLAGCPGCGAVPGAQHDQGCEHALCPDCGEQLLMHSCDLWPAGTGGPDRPAIWHGIDPREEVARALGWWTTAPGADDPVVDDTRVRLAIAAEQLTWDRQRQRYEIDTPAPAHSLAAARPGAARRVRQVLAQWWVFTCRPLSLRAVWRLSGVVDTRRIPGGSSRLATLWWWSTRTDRVLLVAVAVLAVAVAGPLLWCAARPSRRAGLYVVLAGLLLVLLRAGG